MIRLEEKHEQALQFRKRGFTYSEIAKIVGVSKATVSNWLAKKAFSKKVKEDNFKRAAKDNVKRMGLLNKARFNERGARYKEARHSAETEFKHYKKDPLFMAGLMAYLCNGDVSDPSRIRLSSSNPLVHKAFLQLLCNYLGAPKTSVRFWLLLHQGHVEKKCRALWQKSLTLPSESFYKSQIVQQKTVKDTLQHGTGNTIIGNIVLKKKLLRWIELLSEEL